MADDYRTEQECFWAGEFGDEYVQRNRGKHLLSSKISLFSKILAKTIKISSVLELGANIGLNLKAIKRLLPEARLGAVEINPVAINELKAWGEAEVFHRSILDFAPSELWDFVFTSQDRLFKRDFAGDILNRFGDLALVDYGFVYHMDPNFPMDDPTWFLLEKR